MNNKITQDEDGIYVIPPGLMGIRRLSMKQLINETIDRHNKSYQLYVEIKESSLPDHYDVRLFSTYSGASDSTAEQTKWKSTLPKSALESLRQSIEIML